MSEAPKPDSWYVQQIIDNLRINHPIERRTSYFDCLQFFMSLSAVSRDQIAVAKGGITNNFESPSVTIRGAIRNTSVLRRSRGRTIAVCAATIRRPTTESRQTIHGGLVANVNHS